VSRILLSDYITASEKDLPTYIFRCQEDDKVVEIPANKKKIQQAPDRRGFVDFDPFNEIAERRTPTMA
jgi:hypothetical protein